jgi:hypothetical protein
MASGVDGSRKCRTFNDGPPFLATLLLICLDSVLLATLDLDDCRMPKRDADTLTTAKVAKMLAVPKSTLNYWLRTGRLVGPPPDPTNGYRSWREGDVEMLRRIIESELIGLTR